ncbi:MAG: circadian clock protein KaiB [Acidobacteria bacterium]|nr:circadian clock protein KaiB [Acidobacteriota bacterium]
MRLYIAGYTPRSVLAIANIRRTCDHFLRDRYELTVISLVDHAEEAKKERVIAAPTLVKALPLPVRKLIGDLSDEGRVLRALDIHTTDES